MLIVLYWKVNGITAAVTYFIRKWLSVPSEEEEQMLNHLHCRQPSKLSSVKEAYGEYCQCVEKEVVPYSNHIFARKQSHSEQHTNMSDEVITFKQKQDCCQDVDNTLQWPINFWWRQQWQKLQHHTNSKAAKILRLVQILKFTWKPKNDNKWKDPRMFLRVMAYSDRTPNRTCTRTRNMTIGLLYIMLNISHYKGKGNVSFRGKDTNGFPSHFCCSPLKERYFVIGSYWCSPSHCDVNASG